MSSPSVNKRTFETFAQFQDAVCGASEIKDIMSGPCRVVGIAVHNDAGSATGVFLKFWDSLDPTAGTTAPDYCFYIPATFVDSISLPVDGMKFLIGCSYCCIKNVGTTDGPGTSGTTAPTATVKVGLTLLEGIQ